MCRPIGVLLEPQSRDDPLQVPEVPSRSLDRPPRLLLGRGLLAGYLDANLVQNRNVAHHQLVDPQGIQILRVSGEVTLRTYPLVERAVDYPVGVEVAVVEVVLRVDGSRRTAIRVLLPEHSLPEKPVGPGIRVIFRESYAQFPCGAAPVSLLPSGLEGRH